MSVLLFLTENPPVVGLGVSLGIFVVLFLLACLVATGIPKRVWRYFKKLKKTRARNKKLKGASTNTSL